MRVMLILLIELIKDVVHMAPMNGKEICLGCGVSIHIMEFSREGDLVNLKNLPIEAFCLYDDVVTGSLSK